MLVSAGSASTHGHVAVRELALERLEVVELDDARGLGRADRRADVALALDDCPPASSAANDSSTVPW